jgi:hypothetical protein
MRPIVWLFSLFVFLSGPTLLLYAAEPFLVFQPHGHAKGKNIVLISGDEEYRSEESLPQLAKILSAYHGFRCTVLFAINPKDGTIDPNQLDNIPGWIGSARFRRSDGHPDAVSGPAGRSDEAHRRVYGIRQTHCRYPDSDARVSTQTQLEIRQVQLE